MLTAKEIREKTLNRIASHYGKEISVIYSYIKRASKREQFETCINISEISDLSIQEKLSNTTNYSMFFIEKGYNFNYYSENNIIKIDWKCVG